MIIFASERSFFLIKTAGNLSFMTFTVKVVFIPMNANKLGFEIINTLVWLSLSVADALIKLDPEDGPHFVEYFQTHAMLSREKARKRKKICAYMQNVYFHNQKNAVKLSMQNICGLRPLLVDI